MKTYARSTATTYRTIANEEGERVIISVIIVSIKFEICRAINRSSPPPFPVFFPLKLHLPTFTSIVPCAPISSALPFSFNCNLQQIIRSKRRQMFHENVKATSLDVVVSKKKGMQSDGYSGQVTFKSCTKTRLCHDCPSLLLWNNYIF